MNRRSFLRLLAAATAAATVSPLLAACSNDATETNNTTSPASSDPAGAPSNLRIAAIGAPGEALNISEAMSTATWTAMYAVYESLVLLGSAKPQLQLAASVESNEDATQWTITLRDDAQFSDGTPVTPADAFASLQHVAEHPMHGLAWSDVDLARSTASSDSIVLQLSHPRVDFLESVLGLSSLVFKNGDPATGIGSGPYVVESGDSTQGWKLTANKYFPAKQRVSENLEIQVIADAQARLRAVDSGAVDLAMDLPATATRSLRNAEVWTPGETDSKGLLFVLNTKVAPFSDPELRRAMKIAIDRKALVNSALEGTGTAGADVPGLGFADYPAELEPIKHDEEEARRIFQEKNLTELTLVTADFSPGMNDGADLLAQQLEELGVKVSVEKRDPSTYYADMEALKQLPFFASYFVNRSLTSALPFLTGSSGLFNLSGFGTEGDWDTKLLELREETDDKARAEKLLTLAKQLQEEGGEVLWAYANEIHGRTAQVPDLTISQTVPVVIRK